MYEKFRFMRWHSKAIQHLAFDDRRRPKRRLHGVDECLVPRGDRRPTWRHHVENLALTKKKTKETQFAEALRRHNSADEAYSSYEGNRGDKKIRHELGRR